MTPADIIARAYDREQAAQMGEPDPWADGTDHPEWSGSLACAHEAIAALNAAGIRMERDDPVTTVYGRLLWRHTDALRKGDEPRREKLFAAIEILRGEYPAECQVWDDRYDPAIRALADGGGSE